MVKKTINYLFVLFQINDIGLDSTSSCPAYTEVLSLVQSARGGDVGAPTNAALTL